MTQPEPQGESKVPPQLLEELIEEAELEPKDADRLRVANAAGTTGPTHGAEPNRETVMF